MAERLFQPLRLDSRKTVLARAHRTPPYRQAGTGLSYAGRLAMPHPANSGRLDVSCRMHTEPGRHSTYLSCRADDPTPFDTILLDNPNLTLPHRIDDSLHSPSRQCDDSVQSSPAQTKSMRRSYTVLFHSLQFDDPHLSWAVRRANTLRSASTRSDRPSRADPMRQAGSGQAAPDRRQAKTGPVATCATIRTSTGPFLPTRQTGTYHFTPCRQAHSHPIFPRPTTIRQSVPEPVLPGRHPKPSHVESTTQAPPSHAGSTTQALPIHVGSGQFDTPVHIRPMPSRQLRSILYTPIRRLAPALYSAFLRDKPLRATSGNANTTIHSHPVRFDMPRPHVSSRFDEPNPHVSNLRDHSKQVTPSRLYAPFRAASRLWRLRRPLPTCAYSTIQAQPYPLQGDDPFPSMQTNRNWTIRPIGPCRCDVPCPILPLRLSVSFPFISSRQHTSARSYSFRLFPPALCSSPQRTRPGHFELFVPTIHLIPCLT
jgi:hypothetical protein